MTIRVSLEEATREELTAEILRLEEVNNRWSSCWKQIVYANAEAWQDMVKERDDFMEALGTPFPGRSGHAAFAAGLKKP